MTIAIPQSARASAVPNSTYATECWAVVALVSAALLGQSTSLAIAALLPAAAAAAVDAATGRVPDRLLMLAGGAVFLSVVNADDVRSTAAAAVSSALLMATPLLALHLAWPSAMGFGDVKLAMVLGALTGVVFPGADTAAVVASIAIASAATLVVAIAGRRTAVPFAPGLVLGTTTVLALTLVLGLEIPR